MRKVSFAPTAFTLAVRRNHCPTARFDERGRCWWMSPSEAFAFECALNEESQCRMEIVVDGRPVLVGAVNWRANYARVQAAKPVPEDSVDRSRRLRAQWKAESLAAWNQVKTFTIKPW